MVISYLLFILTVSKVSADIFDHDQTRRITKLVEDVMDCQGIPGLTLAVVKGEETWTKGFGTADRERGVNVTTDTLFGIGSLTKAFTTTLLAMLLNETKGLTWTSKVSDILGPDFAFIDEERTRELTLRDLLSHRTGLNTAITSLYYGFNHNYTRAECARRFRFLPEVKPFRDVWEYNNWGYTLAGYIVEVLSRESYEDTLEKRIFQPLGMTKSGILGHSITTDDDGMAKPYFLIENQLQLTDPSLYDIHPGESAGLIASSANDVAKWLQFLLRQGKTQDSETLVSSELLKEAFESHESLSLDANTKRQSAYRPTFPVSEVQVGYGYGWYNAVYRGYKKVWHGGSIISYQSQVALYPDLNCGVFTSVNGPGTGDIPEGKMLTFFISDLLLGEGPWLNASTVCSFPSPWIHIPSPNTGTGVTNDAVSCEDCYVGRYGHQFYGDLEIKVNPESGTLMMHYGKLKGSLNSTADQTQFKMDAWEPYRMLSHPGNKTELLNIRFSGLEKGKYQNVDFSSRKMSFSRGVSFNDEITETTSNVPPSKKDATCGHGKMKSNQILTSFLLVLIYLGIK